MLGYTSGALDSITIHVHILILKWHRAYLRRNPNKLAIKVENAQGMLDWLISRSTSLILKYYLTGKQPYLLKNRFSNKIYF